MVFVVHGTMQWRSKKFYDFFFSRVVFSAELIEKQKDFRGSGGMLPRKNFETLYAVMAILVLFEHFSSKLRSKFLTLILSGLLHQISCILFAHFQLCVLKA